jgi:hypothetical protein
MPLEARVFEADLGSRASKEAERRFWEWMIGQPGSVLRTSGAHKADLLWWRDGRCQTIDVKCDCPASRTGNCIWESHHIFEDGTRQDGWGRQGAHYIAIVMPPLLDDRPDWKADWPCTIVRRPLWETAQETLTFRKITTDNANERGNKWVSHAHLNRLADMREIEGLIAKEVNLPPPDGVWHKEPA